MIVFPPPLRLAVGCSCLPCPCGRADVWFCGHSAAALLALVERSFPSVQPRGPVGPSAGHSDSSCAWKQACEHLLLHGPGPAQSWVLIITCLLI